MSLILIPVFQCPVQNDPHGQHRGPTHPGAHGSVWIWEVSLQRPFLQDAQQVPVHLHERIHRYRTIIWTSKYHVTSESVGKTFGEVALYIYVKYLVLHSQSFSLMHVKWNQRCSLVLYYCDGLALLDNPSSKDFEVCTGQNIWNHIFIFLLVYLDFLNVLRLMSFLLPREQPVTTPCIRSQPKIERTSRIFCRSIWMQFSSLVYESRISGEFWLLLHS